MRVAKPLQHFAQQALKLIEVQIRFASQGLLQNQPTFEHPHVELVEHLHSDSGHVLRRLKARRSRSHGRNVLLVVHSIPARRTSAKAQNLGSLNLEVPTKQSISQYV
jgi:N-formylglutamate amidohydrolase